MHVPVLAACQCNGDLAHLHYWKKFHHFHEGHDPLNCLKGGLANFAFSFKGPVGLGIIYEKIGKTDRSDLNMVNNLI